MNDIKVLQYRWDIIDTNSFLIRDGDKGLLFDVIDSSDLLSDVRDIKDLTVILTHCHYDHIGGLNRLREQNPGVRVISTAECGSYIGNPNRNLSAISKAFMAFYLKKDIDTMEEQELVRRINLITGFSCEPSDITFEDSMTLDFSGHTIELSRFYGHSDDSLIAVIDKKIMFSGDTISGIPTATRLPKGNTKRFWMEDIPRLEQMTDSIKTVYPGHGDPGDLCDMIRINERPQKYT